MAAASFDLTEFCPIFVADLLTQHDKHGKGDTQDCRVAGGLRGTSPAGQGKGDTQDCRVAGRPGVSSADKDAKGKGKGKGKSAKSKSANKTAKVKGAKGIDGGKGKGNDKDKFIAEQGQGGLRLKERIDRKGTLLIIVNGGNKQICQASLRFFKKPEDCWILMRKVMAKAAAGEDPYKARNLLFDEYQQETFDIPLGLCKRPSTRTDSENTEVVTPPPKKKAVDSESTSKGSMGLTLTDDDMTGMSNDYGELISMAAMLDFMSR